MNTELSHLLASRRRARLVADLGGLAERTIRARGGVGGLMLRTGLRSARALDREVVFKVIDRMLPDVLGALNPRWAEFCTAREAGETGGDDFGAFLDDHRDSTVEDLLAVSDAWATRVELPALLTVYKMLRGRAHGFIAPAVADLGRTVQLHAEAD